MLKVILITLLLAIAGLLIFAATRPGSFRLERSLAIKAPPEKIFPYINDLHQHALWSPWEKIDPAMQRSYSGAALGVGAVYGWEGNKEVGVGRMEIIESQAPVKVVLKLDFIKPFEAHNKVDYLLSSSGDTTTVTQAMYGPSPYMSKLMTLFFSMDKMVGPKFEEGLATLKTLAEK